MVGHKPVGEPVLTIKRSMNIVAEPVEEAMAEGPVVATTKARKIIGAPVREEPVAEEPVVQKRKPLPPRVASKMSRKNSCRARGRSCSASERRTCGGHQKIEKKICRSGRASGDQEVHQEEALSEKP